ncbi:hypothetical protein [Kitasatospora sp. NPDC002522]
MEIAVGYVFAWLVGKAKRVAGLADDEVDHALDAGMRRLHDLVSRKLGEDPALRDLTEEAGSAREHPTARTRQQVELALRRAMEQDPAFAESLQHAVAQIQAITGPTAGDGGTAEQNIFAGPTTVQTGSHNTGTAAFSGNTAQQHGASNIQHNYFPPAPAPRTPSPWRRAAPIAGAITLVLLTGLALNLFGVGADKPSTGTPPRAILDGRNTARHGDGDSRDVRDLRGIRTVGEWWGRSDRGTEPLRPHRHDHHRKHSRAGPHDRGHPAVCHDDPAPGSRLLQRNPDL